MASRVLSVIVLLLVAVWGERAALYDRTCTLEDRREHNPNGLCGSRLISTLSNICRAKGGFGRRLRKRSDPELLGTGDLKDLILGKSDAMSYLRLKRSSFIGEQGIVCECCYNMCNLSELTQYCTNP